jgi:DNA polymerase III alpha subunit
LEFDLLFERFLNPERVSMPDFDVDFCMEKRDLVIEHVADMYGREAVSQIITFGTMAAKAVIRDVGRVLGPPLWLRRPHLQTGAARSGHDAGKSLCCRTPTAGNLRGR